jgi:hypothetical protein
MWRLMRGLIRHAKQHNSIHVSTTVQLHAPPPEQPSQIFRCMQRAESPRPEFHTQHTAVFSQQVNLKSTLEPCSASPLSERDPNFPERRSCATPLFNVMRPGLLHDGCIACSSREYVRACVPSLANSDPVRWRVRLRVWFDTALAFVVCI